MFSGNKQIGDEFVLSQNGPITWTRNRPITEQFPHDKALTLFEDHRRPTKGPIIGPFFYQPGGKKKEKKKLDFNILFFSGNIKKTLALISQAADSICDGDLVGRLIREKGNWSLLPMQVCQLNK